MTQRQLSDDELRDAYAQRDAAFDRRDWDKQASAQALIDAEQLRRWELYVACLAEAVRGAA